MGVPALYRWLCERYPSINQKFTENICWDRKNGSQMEKGLRLDCLYLDMNGIIHPCSHPDNRPAPQDEASLFEAIFQYIDMIMKMAKPKLLVYLAIDGVAPYAKITQQRSRRFRKNNAGEKDKEEVTLKREQLLKRGVRLPGDFPAGMQFDSNCISPCTRFMARLSHVLRHYIYDRMQTDALWENVLVFLSDSSVPGEGEHKIMDFIRRQRTLPSYNPNLAHCLFGSDADLILLGLATHEPYFVILREDARRICDLCGQEGHLFRYCSVVSSAPADITTKPLSELTDDNEVEMGLPPRPVIEPTFSFLFLHILRQYLERDLKIHSVSFTWDFERALDDWIVLCTLAGNDFLPQLSNLNVKKDAIESLAKTYIECLKANQTWISHNGYIKVEVLQTVLNQLAQLEQENLQSEGQMNARRRPSSELGPAGDCSGTEKGKEEALLRQKYYKDKFRFDVQKDAAFLTRIATEYVRGLCWVSRYYFQGCASWDWFYPFYYAPLTSDLAQADGLEAANFADGPGGPLRPMEQLMFLFPPDSCNLVPEAWRWLMTEANSPLIDYFPREFKVEVEEGRPEWTGTALLPWVDRARVLKVLDELADELTEEEQKRNRHGGDVLFMHEKHPKAELIRSLHEPPPRSHKKNKKGSKNNRQQVQKVNQSVHLNAWHIGGRIEKLGSAKLDEETAALIASVGFSRSVEGGKVFAGLFVGVEMAPDHVFTSARLSGAVLPARVSPLLPPRLASMRPKASENAEVMEGMPKWAKNRRDQFYQYTHAQPDCRNAPRMPRMHIKPRPRPVRMAQGWPTRSTEHQMRAPGGPRPAMMRPRAAFAPPGLRPIVRPHGP